ncbi:unnamed protein product [Rotaria sordida]|uniref:U-box domain-containing protein n=1 Tax=Rotaria sordida TaxID=392033 RepID=A0A815YTW2_9BILA|nr:unnamed protein product [Rotaria sordida]CAF1575123.1 unnamed protein product [Rotaria sordida]
MKSNVKSDIEIDDLTCPITLQIFRDPVIAADGRTYERAAIVQWITEHGTSPVTREPLDIKELQADDYLRNLAAQQRSSMMAYNNNRNFNNAVVQQQSSTISYNNNINVDPAILTQIQHMPNSSVALIQNAGNHSASCNNFCHKHQFWIAIVTMFVMWFVFLIWGVYVRGRDPAYSMTSTTIATKTTTIRTTTAEDEIPFWFVMAAWRQGWCCPEDWTCSYSPLKCSMSVNVPSLIMSDIDVFEHDLFGKVSQNFPLYRTLCIPNSK